MTENTITLTDLYSEYSKYILSLENQMRPVDEETFHQLITGTADKEVNQCFRDDLRAAATVHKVKYGIANPMAPRGVSTTPWFGKPLTVGVGVPFLDDIMSELQEAALEKGTKWATDTAKRIGENIRQKTEALGRMNNQAGGSQVRGEGFGPNGSESITDILSMPQKVSYNSGVKCTTYKPSQNIPTRDFRTNANDDGRLRSADLACVVQRVPPANDFSITYWQNTLIPNMQLKAQASVGFNINASTNFSYNRVVAVFNLYMDALAKYFFMVNTYSVIQGPGSNDVSRNVLRMMFQTSDLQYLAILRERLNALPIPPKMIERSAFLYSTYKTCINDDVSNNIGFVPVPLQSSSGYDTFDTIDMNLLSTIHNLGELLDNPNHNLKNTVEMMAKVFPNWVSTQVGATQDVPDFSYEFNNIFLNGPVRQSSYLATGSSTFNLPSSSEDSDLCQFVVTGPYVEDKIGDQQAAAGIYRSADLEWSGTLVPEASSYLMNANTLYTSRYTFCYDGGSVGLGWRPSNVSDNIINGFGNLALNQPYANFVAGSDSWHMPPFGTYSVQGNSVKSMSQPAIDWMAEMFDLGSLTSRDTSKKSYSNKKKMSKSNKDDDDE